MESRKRVIKVLLIFSTYGGIGGAEKSLSRMVSSSNKNVNYEIAFFSNKGPSQEFCLKKGITPIMLGNKGSIKILGFGIDSLIKLYKIISKYNFDIIYLIGFRIAILVRVLNKFQKIGKIVVGLRANFNTSTLQDRLFRLSEFLFKDLTDFYICNSIATQRTINKVIGKNYFQKTNVIYNGIDKLPDQKNDYKSRKNLILVVANLSRRKGHLNFIDVIKKVLKEEKDAKFIFLGRNDIGDTLSEKIMKEKLSKNIFLLGYKKNLRKYFNQSKCMVLPSIRNEGCPTSIIEAQAHGLPVIASKIDGIPELIEDNVDGFLINPLDINNFANKIIYILRNAEIAEEMGHKAREKIRTKFPIQKCAIKHEIIFKDLIKEEK